jgi:hypothetical protein
MLTRLHSKFRLPVSLRLVGRFVLGLAIGWLFHYMLYRFSLPVQPFIYVNF